MHLYFYFSIFYAQENLYKLFLKDENKEYIGINLEDNNFIVSYIENSNYKKNKNFPIITVKSNKEIDGFIQIVRTDSCEEIYKEFIDTTEEIKPYYTLGKEFFDAPVWNYHFFWKPLYNWTAHLYAVNTDKETNRKKIIPVLKWGFYFTYFFSFSPTMIKPIVLNEKEIEKDKVVLKSLKLIL